MLPTTNRTIAILRYARTSGKGAYTSVATGIRAYINQTQEEVQEGIDNQGSWIVYRMMTNGTHTDIVIGDRITDDQSNTYEVRGKAISKDLTGTHHQYILVVKYD